MAIPAQVIQEFTIHELRYEVFLRTQQPVSLRSIQRWLYEVCFWCGWELDAKGRRLRRKSLFTEADLEWLLHWLEFRNTRTRSVTQFYRHLKQQES